MNDFLIPGEAALFFAINQAHSFLADHIMYLYSGQKIWIAPAILIIFTIIYKHSWREWLPVLVFIILTVAVCDFVSSGIFKPLIARPRPTSFPGIMEHVRTLSGHINGHLNYGFVSGHATNAFGFATFSALVFRRRSYTVYIVLWATVMAYSRVYLGVHFVSDVVGGMLVGSALGFMVYKLYYITVGKFFSGILNSGVYNTHSVNILTACLAVYTVAFCLLSPWIASGI